MFISLSNIVDRKKDIVCGVYMITNTTNGKCYIGSSKDIVKRIKGHYKLLSENKHQNLKIQNSFNIHGESVFTAEILEECNINDRYKKEQKWLDYFFNNKDVLYNISSKAFGSNYWLGKKRSPETIEKVAAKKRGKSPWNVGLKHSDSHKKKLSIAQTGRKWNEEDLAKRVHMQWHYHKEIIKKDCKYCNEKN